MRKLPLELFSSQSVEARSDLYTENLELKADGVTYFTDVNLMWTKAIKIRFHLQDQAGGK